MAQPTEESVRLRAISSRLEPTLPPPFWSEGRVEAERRHLVCRPSIILYVSSGYDNCKNAQALPKSRCKASHLRPRGVGRCCRLRCRGSGLAYQPWNPPPHNGGKTSCGSCRPTSRSAVAVSPSAPPDSCSEAHIRHVLRLHLVTLQAHLAELRQIHVQHYEKRVFNK